MTSSPKWWQLYALFLLPVLLLVLEQQLPFSAGEHETAQIAIILLAFVLVYLWLVINTVALAETDKDQGRQRVIEKFYPSGLSAASSADGYENEEESAVGIAGDDGSSPVVKTTDVRYDDSSYPFPTSTRPGGAGLVDRDHWGDLSFNCDGASTSDLTVAGQR
jgi:hypothetical protein